MQQFSFNCILQTQQTYSWYIIIHHNHDHQMPANMHAAHRLPGHAHAERAMLQFIQFSWRTVTFTFELLTDNRHTSYSRYEECNHQFRFSMPFCFQVRSGYETDGQTHKQTQRQDVLRSLSDCPLTTMTTLTEHADRRQISTPCPNISDNPTDKSVSNHQYQTEFYNILNIYGDNHSEQVVKFLQTNCSIIFSLS